MNATVKFQAATLKQTGSVGKILMWMQDHEKYLRDTTIKSAAAMMSESVGLSFNATRVKLNKMRNNQMIIKTAEGKRRGRLLINYYQKDIPGYILERAPQEVQDKVKAMKESLKEGQYISEDGCIVTPANNPEPEEPKESEEPEELKLTPSEEPQETEKVAEPTLEPTPEPQEVTTGEVVAPVTVKSDADGMHLTITLNITINK